MGSEVHRPLGLIDRPERILIGIEADLGIDHQALPARNAQSDVGP